MANTLVLQTVLAALVACAALAPVHCGVVSLVDVTGTTPAPRPHHFVEPDGVSFVGYPEQAAAPARRPGVVSLSDVTGLRPEQQAQHATQGGSAYTGLPHAPARPGTVNLLDVTGVAQRPPRPGQGGVVSLTDVTGVAPEYLAQRPSQPRPLHVEQGYDPQRPYTACYVPGAPGPAPYTVPQHPVPLGGVRLARSKRSPAPQHGVVRLSDVAGPGAGRYPSYGPPAYVRPYPYNNYYGYNNYYAGPRPYYNVVPVRMPVACFGLLCL